MTRIDRSSRELAPIVTSCYVTGVEWNVGEAEANAGEPKTLCVESPGADLKRDIRFYIRHETLH